MYHFERHGEQISALKGTYGLFLFLLLGFQCFPQRAALLKSMLNFLKKAIPDPAFTESIRHGEFIIFHRLCVCLLIFRMIKDKIKNFVTLILRSLFQCVL